MLRNEGDALRRVIVCSPRDDYFRVSDLSAQNMNEIADPEKTQEQYNHLKNIIEASGSEVIDMDELPGHPNSVFTRDVALSTPKGYIQLRMGLEARRGEDAWMAGILASLGEPSVGQIEHPGTVEGGDVILAGRVAFVGRSSRTNDEGIRQLTEFLNTMEYEVRVVPVRSTSLHIGGLMSVIGPNRILHCQGAFPDQFLDGFDTIEIPGRGPSHGNVICLRENEVIANSAENRVGIEILKEHGVKVHAIDLSEFRKGAGGPTCLILPVERG